MFKNNMIYLLDYIETNLTEDMNFSGIYKKTLISIEDFNKVFSIIFDITLKQYIRNRRLSEAGKDLLFTNQKIVDVAIKYQYSSSTTFSRAFFKFHGVLPSEVKCDLSILRYYPKIEFNFSKRRYDISNYKIVNLHDIELISISDNVDYYSVKEKIFVLRKKFVEYLSYLTNRTVYLDEYRIYQCCESFSEIGFNIHIAVEKEHFNYEFKDNIPLEVYHIPKGRYLRLSYNICNYDEVLSIWELLLDGRDRRCMVEFETLQIKQIEVSGKNIYEFNIYIPLNREKEKINEI